MLNIIEFKEVIDSFHKELLQIQDEKTHVRLTDDKWALTEIVGHLIDSASNNHQRFVRLQFGDLMGFPAYGAEEWITAQKYINMEWMVLVSLWYNYNRLLLNIIENTEIAVLENVWVRDEETIPFKQLINGYFKHVKLHIDHFNKRQKELI